MKHLVVLLAISAAIFSSCKKNRLKENQPPVFNKNLVAFKPEGEGQWSFFYNSNHQLLSFTSISRTINYKPGTPFSAKKLEQGFANVEFKNAVQDATGRVTKLEAYSGVTLIGKFEFSYNAQGYLISAVKTMANPFSISSYSYEYSNGNLISVTASSNGIKEGSYVFTYFTDKYNPLHIDLFDFKTVGIITDEQFGKQPVNLVKQAKMLSKNGQLVFELNFDYQTNAEGYLSNITVTPLGSAPQLFTCTFE